MKSFEAFYRPIDYLSLQLSRVLEGGRVHTVNSPLGKQFIDAGAEIKGNENLFPGIFVNGRVHLFTYQLRRLCTVHADTTMPFNDERYEDCIGAHKDFWEYVGLPGAPWFWGSAAVVYTQSGKVLLGYKSAKRNTYGGTLTPPAGIVDINDFSLHKIVEDTLKSVSLRELFEETGFDTSMFSYVGIEPHWDIQRRKPQAFVLWKADEKDLSYAIKHLYNPVEREFDKIALIPISIESEHLSTEGVAAINLATKYFNLDTFG